ncbi:MAG: hypothetical protein NW206_20885 [Hyphomonadaceae bacterium]|nr:hypothetical protein [Hyphomonadaceae bacterium]
MHATAASKQLDTTARVDPDELLADAGFDKNGRSLTETDSEEFEGDATRHLDYFERRTDPVTREQDAAREHEYFEEREADQIANAIEIDDIRQAAERDEARAKLLRAKGEHERAKEAERDALELRQLVAVTARRILQVHELFSATFFHAVAGEHWAVAQAHLIDAIRSNEADYALKLSCAKALSEIAQYLPGGTGVEFDGKWLAELTGIPLRTAQDYIASARNLESGVAAIITGTDYGDRAGVRNLVAMTPAKRYEVVHGYISNHLTKYLVAHSITKEKRRRSRNFSITEIRALSVIGLNNEQGWAELLSRDNDAGTAWLAAELDAKLEKDDRNQRALSKATVSRGSRALTELNTRIRRNAR